MKKTGIKITSFIVLLSFLTSCATTTLRPATPVLVAQDDRVIGIAFNPGLSDEYRGFITGRLRGYLGDSTKLVAVGAPDDSISDIERRIASGEYSGQLDGIFVADLKLYDAYQMGNYKVLGDAGPTRFVSSKKSLKRSLEGTLKLFDLKLGESPSLQPVEIMRTIRSRRPVSGVSIFLIFPLGLIGCSLALLGGDDTFSNCLVGDSFFPPTLDETSLNAELQAQLDPILKQTVTQYSAFLEENRQPPVLVASVRFSDTSGIQANNMLNAGEKAELIVTVENQGKGSAFGVKVNVTTKDRGFTLSGSESLDKISAGESKEVRIAVHGGLDLPGGQSELLIETREKQGNDAKKIKMLFQTAALERPDLKIASVRINDTTGGLASGNGNGAIENGETVELLLFVENRGVGDAYGVHAWLDKITPSGIEIVRGKGDMGNIPVGETVKVKMVVRVPRAVDVSALKAEFRVEEVERKAAKAERMFALSGSTLMPDLVAEIDWSDSPSADTKGNGNAVWENGEKIKGTLRIKNKGTLAAENIRIRLVVNNKNIRLSRQEFSLERLNPDHSSAPFHTFVTIPRTYRGGEISVNTVVTQKDFQKVNRQDRYAVNLLKPSLSVSWRILNQSENNDKLVGSVVQGDRTTLEIRVRNTGRLDAEGVTVDIGTDQEFIALSGKKSKKIEIGTIRAGRESEPLTISMNIKNRTEVGDAKVSVEVMQNDFPKLAKNGTLRVLEESAVVVRVAGDAGAKPAKRVNVSRTVNPVAIASIAPAGGIVADSFILNWDEVGDIGSFKILVNDKPLPDAGTSRGIALTAKENTQGRSKRHRVKVPLEPGENRISVVAYDLKNREWIDEIIVNRVSEQGEIWAVVMGVSKYQNIESLKYARRDAEAFTEYLTDYIGVPEDHIRTLYDEKVTVRSMKSAMGGWLKKSAGVKDTVYVYFAGHGAPEEDSTSADGDGFEKYLLPSDAEPGELFSTALPMRRVSEIFQRIKSERMVFIVDSCFSGAAGGRTLLASNTSTRSVLSDKFWDRLSRGKGRVILSASSANEVSVEDSKYGGGHGVFTYYLLEGLKGKADYSRDGLIDIDEAYIYLSKKVPEATGQAQTPVKKGEVEGTLILGRVGRISGPL